MLRSLAVRRDQGWKAASAASTARVASSAPANLEHPGRALDHLWQPCHYQCGVRRLDAGPGRRRRHHRDLNGAGILTSEQDKPYAEALGEIDYAAACIEFYAEEAKRVAGELLVSHGTDARLMVLRQLIGVVAANQRCPGSTDNGPPRAGQVAVRVASGQISNCIGAPSRMTLMVSKPALRLSPVS